MDLNSEVTALPIEHAAVLEKGLVWSRDGRTEESTHTTPSDMSAMVIYLILRLTWRLRNTMKDAATQAKSNRQPITAVL